MFKKFGQDLPQSLVDAVAGIMEAEKYPEPAKPDPEAIARRKKLQALKDKQDADRAEKGEDKPKSNVKVHKGTYGTEYKGDMEEELKGGQHKIDANKNGKIDAHDFKLLRGKKKTNEEVEEIGERELTPGEAEKKEKYVKSMKKGLAGFKKRYGERGKSVMYATATKMAKEDVDVDAYELVLDLRENKDDLPFDPDKSPKKSAVAGKHGYGPSAARHLARQGLKKALDKKKTNETMMGKAGCTSEEVVDERIMTPGTGTSPDPLIARGGISGDLKRPAEKERAVQNLKTAIKSTVKNKEHGKSKLPEETEIEESRGHKIIATKLKQIDMMSSGKAPDLSANIQSIKDKIKDVANVKKSEIVTQKDTSMHDSAVDNENDELEMKHKLNKMSHGYGKVHHAEEVEITEDLTEEHSFGSNVDSHIKSLGHGKIGFVMDQKKDGLTAVHHQDGNKHHVSIFHKGNLVHQSTHDNFEGASGHAHSSLTSKKGMKSLNLMNETAALDQYIKSMGYDPMNMDKNKKVMFSKTNAFKRWAQQKEALYDGGQKGTQDIDTHMSPGATARG